MATPRRTRPAGLAAVRIGWVAVLVRACAAAVSAAAAPMDLGNPEARFVEVSFEISPADRPGQTDTVWGPPLEAWLEPEPDTSRIRATIAARDVEAYIVREHQPVAGSFSDFVWSFDPGTGHVHSASLWGTVVRTLDWGIAKSRALARVRFSMDTFAVGGFLEPRNLLGQPVNYFCDPDRRRGCRRVAPRRYDPATGYVMAVGPIEVENEVLGMRTFSTLGETRWSEREPVAEDGADAPLRTGLHHVPR